VIVGSNTAGYLYTVVDDNRFTIDLSENITGGGLDRHGADAFGGANCNIFFGSLPHIATGVVIDGCQVEHNDPANAAIGIGVGGGGDVTIGDEGRVSGCTVRNCGQFGFARAYMDKGNGSIWGPGNIGLPNAPIANSIVMPDGWQLTETVPLVGAVTIDRGGLAAFRNLMIMVHHAAHNSGATQNMSVEFIKNGSDMLDSNGDYSRQGIATSTSKILFCGAVAAGVKCQSLMIVRNWNSSHPKHVSVRGGTDNVNTSLMNFRRLGRRSGSAVGRALRGRRRPVVGRHGLHLREQLMAWRQIAARLGVTGVPTITFDSLGDWFALWITINGWKHNDASTRTFGFQAQSGATLLNNAADYSRGGYAPVIPTMFELCTSVPQNTEIQGSFTFPAPRSLKNSA
jgi:hypothetical protein